jgi:hypothetical protein
VDGFRRTPAALLRFFNEEDHARSFIAGRLRFGLLASYRTIEDSRRDETEGETRFVWNLPNPVYYDGGPSNTRFILCTSHPEADRSVLTQRFGTHIVRIHDPKVLLERIDVAWRDHPWASGSCVIVPVAYNKEELLEPAPYLIPPPDYSYRQKPRSFGMEMEFRYVLTCTGDPKRALGSFLTLPLPDCSDVCSILT